MRYLLLTLCLFVSSISIGQVKLTLDYNEGLDRAKQLDKPIFLLFSGRTCVPIVEKQKQLFGNMELQELLNNHFITVVLYVDDRTPLDEAEIIKIGAEEHRIKTFGFKWAEIERSKFGRLTQPLFAVIDKDENILLKALFPIPEAAEVVKMLNQVLKTL